MLKAAGFVIKFIAFTVLVLVIGNWVTWEGKTLSEHVRLGVFRAERSDAAAKVRDWTRNLTQDAREGAERKHRRRDHGSPRALATASRQEAPTEDRTETDSAAPARARAEARADTDSDRIPSSERQKLRELIRELNTSHRKD